VIQNNSNEVRRIAKEHIWKICVVQTGVHVSTFYEILFSTILSLGYKVWSRTCTAGVRSSTALVRLLVSRCDGSNECSLAPISIHPLWLCLCQYFVWGCNGTTAGFLSMGIQSCWVLRISQECSLCALEAQYYVPTRKVVLNCSQKCRNNLFTHCGVTRWGVFSLEYCMSP